MIHARKKSLDDKPKPIIPTSDAELRLAQNGICSLLPRSTGNLKILLQQINTTGRFDIELADYLRRQEGIQKFVFDLARSIQTGKPVDISNADLPLLKRNFGKFSNSVVEILKSFLTV